MSLLQLSRDIASHVSKQLRNRAQRFIAERWSSELDLLHVVEFPRSGGTWVAEMLADYLEVPFPKNDYFPTACPAVLHHHWGEPPPDLGTSPVFVLRDGRDAAVSQYFRVRTTLENPDNFKQRRFWLRYPRLVKQLSAGVDEDRRLLVPFLRDWLRSPAGADATWHRQIRAWRDYPRTRFVKYEDLNRDCLETMIDLLERLGADIEPEFVECTVEKFSFERQTGRSKGEEAPSEAKRKGITGDYINHFSREAGELFHEHAGDVLLETGYESDPDWFRDLPQTPN